MKYIILIALTALLIGGGLYWAGTASEVADNWGFAKTTDADYVRFINSIRSDVDALDGVTTITFVSIDTLGYSWCSADTCLPVLIDSAGVYWIDTTLQRVMGY